MLRIENVRERNGDNFVVDLQVSTTDDLPELHEDVEGISIMEGSIAHVIQEGKFYTLDDDGNWYDEDGNEVE